MNGEFCQQKIPLLKHFYDLTCGDLNKKGKISCVCQKSALNQTENYFYVENISHFSITSISGTLSLFSK